MFIYFLSNLNMGGGNSAPVSVIALNLDAWSAQLLSSDGDPLAVDPGGAVAVSSDTDPLAVDLSLRPNRLINGPANYQNRHGPGP